MSCKLPMLQISTLQNTTTTDISKNHQITTTADLENLKKSEKKVRNYFPKIIFFVFFEFITEDVLKPLLKRGETTRKKSRNLLHKKNVLIFFEFVTEDVL